MAFHAIKAGEGDIFLVRWRRVRVAVHELRRGRRRVGDAQNPGSRRPPPAAIEIAKTNETWTDPREQGLLPDVYLAMGQTAENVATLRGHLAASARTSGA